MHTLKRLDDMHYKDLWFRENRVRHYVGLLSGLRYPKTVPITGIEHALGDIADPKDAEFKPFGDYERFGGSDTYGRFRFDVVIPDDFDGQCVLLNVCNRRDGSDDVHTRWHLGNPGFLIWVDGDFVGHYDRFHRSIKLADSAKAGQRYHIELKYWTEHGSLDTFGPVLRTFDAETEELFYDINVPLEEAQMHDQQSGVRAELINPISEACSMLDLRRPHSEEYHRSVKAAREYLAGFYNDVWPKRALDARVECIGHAHIDIAWMWRIHQTREKAIRTFVNALNYLDTNPDYTFFSSQALLYKMVKEDMPELYERIKKAVASGRWEVDGGMFVEADCNLPSGESLVRQFLYGTKFFKEEFGVDCKLLWLPDVFGYSAALPQILRGCGIKYFTTAKVSSNEYNTMPHDTFMWKGIDGSEVLSHLITSFYWERVTAGNPETSYNTALTPSFIAGGWKHYHDKDLTRDIFAPMGWGDGGGGSADYMLQNQKRMQKGLPDAPKAVWGHVGDTFERWERELEGNRFLATWANEIYYEKHRGTLTSMARIKRKNRKAEFLLAKTELLALNAHLALGAPYDKEGLDYVWERILTNQFHDILPGSSLKEVYDDADEYYAEAFTKVEELEAAAKKAIVEGIQGRKGDIIVFNPSGFERTEPVRVGDDEFTVIVPPKGYALVKPERAEGRVAEFDGSLLETPLIKVSFDADGFINSIYDKTLRRPLLKEGGRANLLRAYEDKPLSSDAWDIDAFYREKFWDVTDLVSSELVENTPYRAVVRQVRRFMRSELTQDIVFYAHTPRIDFVTYTDWKETHILLKAHFETNIHANKATFEIQFGAIERPTHENTQWDFAKFEVCGHKFADLSEGSSGVAILNDCKYGYSVRGGNLGLSLIKCAAGPNYNADREEHWFTYSFYPHAGSFARSDVPKEALSLNLPLEAVVKENDGGSLPASFSFVKDVLGGCVIDTVKRAEDSEDVIVRIYEPYGHRATAELEFGMEFDTAERCDLLENPTEKLTAEANGRIKVELGAFEIVTLRLKGVRKAW